MSGSKGTLKTRPLRGVVHGTKVGESKLPEFIYIGTGGGVRGKWLRLASTSSFSWRSEWLHVVRAGGSVHVKSSAALVHGVGCAWC